MFNYSCRHNSAIWALRGALTPQTTAVVNTKSVYNLEISLIHVEELVMGTIEEVHPQFARCWQENDDKV